MAKFHYFSDKRAAFLDRPKVLTLLVFDMYFEHKEHGKNDLNKGFVHNLICV